MWSVPWAKIGFDNCWLIKNKMLMRHEILIVKQYLSFVSLLSACLPGRTSIEWLTTVPVLVHRYSFIHAFRNYQFIYCRHYELSWLSVMHDLWNVYKKFIFNEFTNKCILISLYLHYQSEPCIDACEWILIKTSKS